jgi:polyhydroxyalkanoate synthase
VLKLLEEGGRAMSGLLERPDTKVSAYSAASEASEATKTLGDIFSIWLADPAKFAEAQASLITSYAELWNTSLRKLMGEAVPDLIEPDPSDSRFKDPEWTTNPFFDFWKQAYLLTTHWGETILKETAGLDDEERRRAEFYFRQLSSAFSPSNFPLTNPEVLRETLQSNAHNLVQGLSHFMRDMERSGDLLKISQTDTEAFEVGKNLAVTPGKIVFQNELFQLIQYAPTTDKVREVPLLVIPPWINKYYILDLTPSKSLLKYAVDQGFTVFVVSWVNPDESLARKGFEDYMLEGVLTATDAVLRETGVEKCNAVGYCVGGTLLGCALSYLAARGEQPFHSVTFLTTQLDFTKAGDLLLFTSDSQLTSLEELMDERGYLDGSRMASVFNMMRPRDLIWPYVVNNYLLGKKPFPFDLLYWNQDSTRMPAANHNFYLREFYGENALAKGEMTLGGIKLDLRKVKLPIMEVATKEDHIAPAKSVFIGAKLLGSDVEFVLAGSGHIAGVVNSPDKMKYQHWTGPKVSKVATLDEWMSEAEEHPGSWWPRWAKWLDKYSGDWIEPREPGETLGAIEPAPGSYVRTKS